MKWIGAIELDNGHTGLIYQEGCRLMSCDLTTGEAWDTETPFDCTENGAREAAIQAWGAGDWNFIQISDVADLMDALDRDGVESDQYQELEVTAWYLPCGETIFVHNDEILDSEGKIEYSNDTWIERRDGNVIFHGGRDGSKEYEVGDYEWIAASIDSDSLAHSEEGL